MFTTETLEVAKRRAMKRRTRRHVGQEAMTLVEIMVVVIIMALIATAVGVAVLPQLNKARIKQARTDCSTIQAAAQMWIAESPGKCPSMQQLRDDGQLDKSKSMKDPWDHDYAIECNTNEVLVSSAGPDGQTGTEDDIK